MVIQTYFSHLYIDHMMYEYDKHHFLFEGVTQEQVLSICATRRTKTLNSHLEAELSRFV